MVSDGLGNQHVPYQTLPEPVSAPQRLLSPPAQLLAQLQQGAHPHLTAPLQQEVPIHIAALETLQQPTVHLGTLQQPPAQLQQSRALLHQEAQQQPTIHLHHGAQQQPAAQLLQAIQPPTGVQPQPSAHLHHGAQQQAATQLHQGAQQLHQGAYQQSTPQKHQGAIFQPSVQLHQSLYQQSPPVSLNSPFF